MLNSASAPHCGLSVTRHFGCSPPPHSSVNSTLVPSLLNVAECQNAKFESAAAAMRRGLAGSLMSSSTPYPAHAPPATPSAGYTVISWHCTGPCFGPGGLLLLTILSTI